ncbi:MAG: hypothetical protein D3913_04860, partial [Candidatus Electrothrix sp. LOE1_4_5]|nr:hypothetical protein [Candidatus Electrothrix gigas]
GPEGNFWGCGKYSFKGLLMVAQRQGAYEDRETVCGEILLTGHYHYFLSTSIMMVTQKVQNEY